MKIRTILTSNILNISFNNKFPFKYKIKQINELRISILIFFKSTISNLKHLNSKNGYSITLYNKLCFVLLKNLQKFN